MTYDVRELPPPLHQNSTCERCFEKEKCMVLNKLMDDYSDDGSDGDPFDKAIYDLVTEHLTLPVHKQFFNHWDSLISKEEGMVNSFKKDLWVYSSKEREKNGGKAVGNLTVVQAVEEPGKRMKFVYTFERAPEFGSMKNSHLSKFDRVIVSDEDGHFWLASGFIELIRSNKISFRTDRQFLNSRVKLPTFDMTTNQVFQTVLNG
ncbi:unnamed protein product [Ambrosiozyma monospora]|uniref:Unnamed protein product n=1 Tax=Ambrosiozyma monospora TaxID=43982 RepID=A0ACB5UCV1_AMBMO|nr:unnamed protein product [Ambrosiozyma monospora]